MTDFIYLGAFFPIVGARNTYKTNVVLHKTSFNFFLIHNCLVRNLALVMQEEEQEGEEEDLVAPPPKMSKKSGDQEKKSGKQPATKKSGKRGQNTEEEEGEEVKPVMKSVIRKGEFGDPTSLHPDPDPDPVLCYRKKINSVKYKKIYFFFSLP